MTGIEELVRRRRSVRTYEARPVSPEDRAALEEFLADSTNPLGIPVEFRLLEGRGAGLTCPVITGGEELLWLGAAVPRVPGAEEACGYALEAAILFAQSLGLGTLWVGGTFDRAGFEKKMAFSPNKMMPCVTPLGHPAGKMALKEVLMRKSIRADTRLDFGAVFFDREFGLPLTEAAAGELALPLECVRLGPSAVNRQPWRVLVRDRALHFYRKGPRVTEPGHSGSMQKVDLGIALCHFELAAREPVWSRSSTSTIA